MTPSLLRPLAACAALALLVTALPAQAQGGAPRAGLIATPAKPATPVTTATAAIAPSADLRVTHYSRNIGKDGVQRETTYTNHVYRRPDQLWIERERPAILQASLAHGHEHAHGPHAGHAHDEAEGAPLLLRRDSQGQVAVKIVLRQARRVIDVDRAHHGNVGYGGSWDTAYWMVTPAALQAMQPQGGVQGGVQRYRHTQDERTTTVDWDVRGQYPRRIEQQDAHGTAYYRLTATRLPGGRQPWADIGDYDAGDYSDLLD